MLHLIQTFHVVNLCNSSFSLNHNKSTINLVLSWSLMKIWNHTLTKNTHHRTNLRKRKHCLHHFCDLNERTSTQLLNSEGRCEDQDDMQDLEKTLFESLTALTHIKTASVKLKNCHVCVKFESFSLHWNTRSANTNVCHWSWYYSYRSVIKQTRHRCHIMIVYITVSILHIFNNNNVLFIVI